uniref:uncharacterized protein C10orf95-like n=1 Tax=Nyctereutes procyonoides TaxID=34880 RepID=UPI0024450338|nr:uncharacterized protein C10orf95-like [Nyctereutes procyonoides]
MPEPLGRTVQLCAAARGAARGPRVAGVAEVAGSQEAHATAGSEGARGSRVGRAPEALWHLRHLRQVNRQRRSVEVPAPAAPGPLPLGGSSRGGSSGKDPAGRIQGGGSSRKDPARRLRGLDPGSGVGSATSGNTHPLEWRAGFWTECRSAEARDSGRRGERGRVTWAPEACAGASGRARGSPVGWRQAAPSLPWALTSLLCSPDLGRSHPVCPSPPGLIPPCRTPGHPGPLSPAATGGHASCCFQSPLIPLHFSSDLLAQ